VLMGLSPACFGGNTSLSAVIRNTDLCMHGSTSNQIRYNWAQKINISFIPLLMKTYGHFEGEKEEEKTLILNFQTKKYIRLNLFDRL
jgi:hypothetical protein